jgi:hypothetical protein
MRDLEKIAAQMNSALNQDGLPSDLTETRKQDENILRAEREIISRKSILSTQRSKINSHDMSFFPKAFGLKLKKMNDSWAMFHKKLNVGWFQISSDGLRVVKEINTEKSLYRIKVVATMLDIHEYQDWTKSVFITHDLVDIDGQTIEASQFEIFYLGPVKGHEFMTDMVIDSIEIPRVAGRKIHISCKTKEETLIAKEVFSSYKVTS